MTTHTPLSRLELSSSESLLSVDWKEEYHAPLPHANVISTLPGDQTVASKCHPFSRFPLDTHFSQRVVWLEWRIMRKASDLVTSGVCPNFVRHYKAYVAPTRLPTMLNKPTPPWSLYTINEYCDGGDLEHWQMARGPHSPEEWQSMMGQFLLGYAALSGMLGVLHCDMHWGNLLMKKAPAGGYWWYIVKRGKSRWDFFVPNTGQQWKLWDFGQSHVIPPAFRNSSFVRQKQAHDLENILGGPWEFAHHPNQHPVIRGECKHSFDALFEEETPDALDVLEYLDWYKNRPRNSILLNPNPYIITLPE